MTDFAEMHLPAEPTAIAPDGSEVRVLLGLEGGGMAQFELAPGLTSKAIRHRTVEEIWVVTGGHGQMWRRQGDTERVIALEPGVCLTIPLGTSFQFRAGQGEPLVAIGVTMPPWPGDAEAEFVEGCPAWR